MKLNRKNILILASTSLILAISGFGLHNNSKKNALPYFNQPDFMPEWLSAEQILSTELHTIAPFNFTNQFGQTIDQNSVAGKIYVANFFFTTCGSICPRMTDNLIPVQERFADRPEVLLLSHTVMPWVDTEQQLMEYAEARGLKAGKWHLLTGDQDELYTLARQSYFAEEEPGYDRSSDEFLHTEHVLLIDAEGHIRGVYNGTLQLEVDRLIEDIELLLN